MAKAAKKTDETPGEGHNSGGSDMSEKDRKVLFFINRKDWLAAMEAKKAADAKVKQVGKAIKADLGKYGLDQIKAYEQAQTPEGLAELKARRDADLQAMRFAGVPVNTQLDIFLDRASAAERAFNDGEEAGLRGDTLANPYNEASPEGQAFAKGWNEGQGALFAGIKQKQEDAETKAELIKSVPFGGDDGPNFPDGEDD
ncbi:hypothetical protein C5748_18245 [Phyllobacterium phragmitis]|uniref:Uncharacterized protein n=1 Tax=Phyllobacterium phragmitis TaxID=2670329 RepID=A0A2S9INI1_9HYPH|nr:hypothetical protein [Phyllobacterium phragmitis]PRD42096.1 hypothetical protein C5748_18245 [Phyllobacterium phragmitis]